MSCKEFNWKIYLPNMNHKSFFNAMSRYLGDTCACVCVTGVYSILMFKDFALLNFWMNPSLLVNSWILKCVAKPCWLQVQKEIVAKLIKCHAIIMFHGLFSSGKFFLGRNFDEKDPFKDQNQN